MRSMAMYLGFTGIIALDVVCTYAEVQIILWMHWI